MADKEQHEKEPSRTERAMAWLRDNPDHLELDARTLGDMLGISRTLANDARNAVMAELGIERDSDSPQTVAKSFLVSKAQARSMTKVMKKTDMSQSEFIRFSLQLGCEYFGEEFADDFVERGKYLR